MTTTTAEKIADAATRQRREIEIWNVLNAACEKAGRIEAREYGRVRWVFEDASAIVICEGGFDVLHPECTCGWCWEGAGLRCDEDEDED